jgi:NTP pyrophosphatase (non-canonical NTP hydrolase)
MSFYDPELEVGSRLMRALINVGTERYRQEHLKATGKFKQTLADPMPEHESLSCILEEVGEVARIVLNRDDGGRHDQIDASDAALRKELSQIAALSVAWMERLG